MAKSLLLVAAVFLAAVANAACPSIVTGAGYPINVNNGVNASLTLQLLNATTLQPQGAAEVWEVNPCGNYLGQQSGGVVFDHFANGLTWEFNGSAVVGVLASSTSSNVAHVALLCGKHNHFAMFQPPTVGYSTKTPGQKKYNFTFTSKAACPTKPTLQPSETPFTTYECKGEYCTAVPSYLVEAVESHGAPGMAAAAVRLNSTGQFEVLYEGTVGRFTYDSTDAQVTKDTLFDMASCTKVVTTTTATAQLYQLGLIDLKEPVMNYLDGFAQYGKDKITIHNLLVHNAGFPPDPNPGYSSPIFPCPQNANYHPAQEFSCDKQVYTSVLNQTLQYPTGSMYLYSDLSFITLMFVVGERVRNVSGTSHPTNAALQKVADLKLSNPCRDASDRICWFHAYVKEFIFDSYGMSTAGFIPTDAGLTPPQWYDPWYHHGQIWGYVSDQNAYAMGGISGHAGLFASVQDSMKLMMQWMKPAAQPSSTNPSTLSEATVNTFIKVQNTTQSSRALGWDTMYDPKTGLWCGTLSKKTFFHIGFTGTQLCGDPVNEVFTVLLANGRYPHYHIDGMISVRPAYNELIKDLLEATRSSKKSHRGL